MQVFYEVKITEHLPTDFGDDHTEKDPHVLRVGWSVNNSSFQLGKYKFNTDLIFWVGEKIWGCLISSFQYTVETG